MKDEKTTPGKMLSDYLEGKPGAPTLDDIARATEQWFSDRGVKTTVTLTQKPKTGTEPGKEGNHEN